MASVFTRIIEGSLPGRFVWKDDEIVAFLSIAPLQPGHVLVVTRQEVDHWVDLSDALRERLFAVSHEIARAIDEAFQPVRVGLAIQGLEVPHVHVHLVPIHQPSHMEFRNADLSPTPEALEEAAEKIRAALRARGAAHVV